MSFLRKQITVENEKSQYNVPLLLVGSFPEEKRTQRHFVFNFDRLVIREKKVESFQKLSRRF